MNASFIRLKVQITNELTVTLALATYMLKYADFVATTSYI